MPSALVSVVHATDSDIRVMCALTEFQWQRIWFVPLFLELGWTGHHETDSRKSKTRTPGKAEAAALDWLLWRERILHVELKAEGGYASKGQKETIKGLVEAGGDVKLWYPRMWYEIVEELTRYDQYD